jgi:hypothetical protein
VTSYSASPNPRLPQQAMRARASANAPARPRTVEDAEAWAHDPPPDVAEAALERMERMYEREPDWWP